MHPKQAPEFYRNPLAHERFVFPWPPEVYWKSLRMEDLALAGQDYAWKVADIVKRTRREAHAAWLAEKYDLDGEARPPLDVHHGPQIVTVRLYAPEDGSDSAWGWLVNMGARVVDAARRADVWSGGETYAIRIDRGAPPSDDPHVELFVDTVEDDGYPWSYRQ